ncbi:MAG: tetratricopeptide repeat protein [Phycisphaerales bacterium]|nr:tetratricopeptide repeat protein [Phycisphaerales bacterium]
MSRPRRAEPRNRTAPPAAAPITPPSARSHLLTAAGVTLVVLIAYWAAPRASFVYDDNYEILQNRLIQDPALLWKALTSDVWAFKGYREQTWSNYWRPTTVFVKAMCHRAFANDPAGWHVVCVLLHWAASLLVYATTLRFAAGWPIATATALLFAAHPAHVESVVWIAAIPDPLMTCLLLGSYLVYLAARTRPLRGGGALLWSASVLLYLLGQGCKESAIFYPAAVALTELILRLADRHSTGSALRSAVLATIPFAALAALFLSVRGAIVGWSVLTPPDAVSVGSMILSAPFVLLFYLRQALFPLWLAPMYSLRPLDPAGVEALLGIAPGAPLLAIGVALWWAGRRNPLYRLAGLWFLLPIALALNTRVFLREDMVHDRYLYLSIFGAMLALATAARDLLSRRSPGAGRHVAAIGAAVAILFSIRAAIYVPVWSTDTALWEAATRADPNSAKAWTELGEVYRQSGRIAEAVAAIERAAQLNPLVTNQIVIAAMLAIQDGRPEAAERPLRDILRQYPDFVLAIDQLANALEKQGRFDDAIAVFEQGRRSAPYRVALYSVNIAVLHKRAGRDADAQRELEGALDAIRAVNDPGALNGLYFLGELHRAAGRIAEARAMYREYLQRTAPLIPPTGGGRESQVLRDTRNRRELAQRTLAQLGE